MRISTEPKINRQQVLDWLAEQVPKPRLNHILRVEDTAIELAEIHYLDSAQAAEAGLLHDVAKYFEPRTLLKIARSHSFALDPLLEANPHLLHAPVGAVVAQEEFGVKDRGVLDAIANHTLGSPDMGDLSCVLFLADGMEPGRGDHPKLEKIRTVSRQNLYQGVSLMCDFKLRRLLKNNQPIHPQMVLTRNWALGKLA
ncbi:MAG: bis(5'-nucleosyl)-tetraphosphatase (symmetrical) YqeK [Thermosynechococcaceae cyanobacterium]